MMTNFEKIPGGGIREVAEIPKGCDGEPATTCSLISCPRCSKNHYNVPLRFFTYKSIGEDFNLWCMCPVLKEPVVVKIISYGEMDESVVTK